MTRILKKIELSLRIDFQPCFFFPQSSESFVKCSQRLYIESYRTRRHRGLCRCIPSNSSGLVIDPRGRDLHHASDIIITGLTLQHMVRDPPKGGRWVQPYPYRTLNQEVDTCLRNGATTAFSDLIAKYPAT